MGLELTFGALDGLLAELHAIDGSKRTAFQGRLKNFLKLGLLEGVKQGRGRAATFSAGDVIIMALAMEFTQLGLTPDRIVTVLQGHRQIVLMAVAGALAGQEFYLQFDPRALSDLSAPDGSMDIFFHAGTDQGPVTTSRGTTLRRSSNINLSVLLKEIAAAVRTSTAEQFLAEAGDWATADPEVRIVTNLALGGKLGHN